MTTLPPRPRPTGDQDESADGIWHWYRRLSDACSATLDDERLDQIAAEVEGLIAQAADTLRPEVHTYNTSEHDLKDGWLASFHALLGNCRARQNRRDVAVDCYRCAVQLQPENMHHAEALIHNLIQLGRYDEAIEQLNAIKFAYLRLENDSTARHILDWACNHSRIASGISDRTLKECVRLISQHGGLPVKRESGAPDS